MRVLHISLSSANPRVGNAGALTMGVGESELCLA
jgi:hypothetical protein